ncbi:unnamed protein product [Peniophora sp. CBMAI 1063]|nr:unnamed protein product [Peniophora sp. CBMAI 1063]
MKFSSSFVALASFCALAIAKPAPSPAKPFGAVYMINNDLADNYVIAAQIGQDGLLTDLTATAAQGAGARGRPTNTGPLFSQGPVQVNQATGRLAAVNAGSNTIQMYNIDPKNPTKLTPIGSAVPSGGDFPESIAINNAGDQLCVLNGGLESNVQCFLVDSYGGLTPTSTGDVKVYNQTQNPPMGPPGTASQVIFTPDQEAVIAIVKGMAGDFDNSPGYMRIWPITNDAVLADEPFEIDIRPPYGGLTFSLSQIPGRNAFVGSDVVNGALVVDMTWGAGNTTITPLNITHNKGNCWSVTAPKTGTYFISDLLNEFVNEVQLDDDLTPTLLRQYPMPKMGPNEAVVADVNGQEFMYMLLEEATSFGVFRLNAPGDAELVQLLDITVPIENMGINVDYLLLSGMNIYLADQ